MFSVSLISVFLHASTRCLSSAICVSSNGKLLTHNAMRERFYSCIPTRKEFYWLSRKSACDSYPWVIIVLDPHFWEVLSSDMISLAIKQLCSQNVIALGIKISFLLMHANNFSFEFFLNNAHYIVMHFYYFIYSLNIIYM